MSTFTVVLDACVLYPAPLRDLLMHLAMTDMFSAKWTKDIHDEWIENLLEQRPDLTRDQLNRTRALMDANVRDCLVSGYEAIVPALILPDADDRHVLAAAIVCGADAIITTNLKDFPDEALKQYGIEAQHPDVFIRNLCDLSINQVCSAVKKQRATLKNPPIPVDRFLQTLHKQGLAQTVAVLKNYADLI